MLVSTAPNVFFLAGKYPWRQDVPLWILLHGTPGWRASGRYTIAKVSNFSSIQDTCSFPTVAGCSSLTVDSEPNFYYCYFLRKTSDRGQRCNSHRRIDRRLKHRLCFGSQLYLRSHRRICPADSRHSECGQSCQGTRPDSENNYPCKFRVSICEK